MIEVKSILVPTDFSDFSRYALDYALTMAQTFKARIILIHVTPENVKQRQAEDRKRLEEFIPPELKKGLEVEIIHKVGIPFVEIIRAAKEKKTDLIVMATHGRSGLSHILFGSVAEKVVRKSTCPVLSIRPREHEFTMP
jgi:nucleotide-binding universal stress UspA family protein